MTSMTLETLAERLMALENEMARVKERLEAPTVHEANPWLDYVYGAFKDDPLFEEAVRYGREWRDAQNESDDEADDVPDGHG